MLAAAGAAAEAVERERELAVRAALAGEREHVYHAVMLDPLTGALLTLDRIRSMVDELLAAHAAFLRPLGW